MARSERRVKKQSEARNKEERPPADPSMFTTRELQICQAKKQFKTLAKAKKFIRHNQFIHPNRNFTGMHSLSMHVYRCHVCDKYHLTKQRPRNQQ